MEGRVFEVERVAQVWVCLEVRRELEWWAFREVLKVVQGKRTCMVCMWCMLWMIQSTVREVCMSHAGNLER